MIVRLAGLEFEIGPDERLLGPERAALGGLQARAGGVTAADAGATRSRWEVRVEATPLWSGDGSGGPPEGDPAEIEAVDGALRLSHVLFSGLVRPDGGIARFRRKSGQPVGLEITLRVALCCRLPLAGGLPLHAAGVAMDGRGFVFFGPSGAGKSTIAGLSPHPVLSDELVAVTPANEGFSVATTGFWGEFGLRQAPQTLVPLAGLFALEKGPGPRIVRLDRRDALMRLLDVITIPSAPSLWRAAMRVLGRLVETVPVYRLTWSPDRPPWDALGGLPGPATVTAPGRPAG